MLKLSVVFNIELHECMCSRLYSSRASKCDRLVLSRQSRHGGGEKTHKQWGQVKTQAVHQFSTQCAKLQIGHSSKNKTISFVLSGWDINICPKNISLLTFIELTKYYTIQLLLSSSRQVCGLLKCIWIGLMTKCLHDTFEGGELVTVEIKWLYRSPHMRAGIIVFLS